jgi:hypothetical protein
MQHIQCKLHVGGTNAPADTKAKFGGKNYGEPPIVGCHVKEIYGKTTQIASSSSKRLKNNYNIHIR